MIARVVLAALYAHIAGIEQRYFVVDGADYRAIGKHYFERLVRERACRTVETRHYRRERVTVHMCDV
jgi:hypothetical protein